MIRPSSNSALRTFTLRRNPLSTRLLETSATTDPAAVNSRPISNQTWDGIGAAFTLPALAQVRRRLAELMEDPEPVMQRLVRVIGDGTCCPGFQFRDDGSLHPVVIALFDRALGLKIPHNYFTAWMIMPLPGPGIRPVDALDRHPQLAVELDAFARRIAPRPPSR